MKKSARHTPKSVWNITFYSVIILSAVALLFLALVFILSSFQQHRQMKDTAYAVLGQITGSIESGLTSLRGETADVLMSLPYYQLESAVENNELPVDPNVYYSVYQDFRNYTESSNLVESFMLYVARGMIRASWRSDYTAVSTVDFSYEDYIGKDALWIAPETVLPLGMHDGGRGALGLMYLIGKPDSEEHGFVLFEASDDLLKGNADYARITPSSHFFIICGGKNIFSDAAVPEIGNPYISDSFRENGYIYFYQPVELDDLDVPLGVLAAVPYSEMVADQRILLIAFFMMAVALAFFAVYLYKTMQMGLTEPVQRLKSKISTLEENNFISNERISGGLEIEMIDNSIDELAKRIRTLIDELNTEMDNRRVAELNILTAQINPHFLYNALDVIYQLCTIGEIKEAQMMTSELAQFYRIGVSKGGNIISLADEIEHVRMYLSIMKTRFGDFTFEIDFPEYLGRYRTVKTILQPIAENAIYHGIRPRRSGGTVLIKASKRDDEITITVSDDGVGISLPELSYIKTALRQGMKQEPGKLYGLVNVNERIRMTYIDKGSYGIDIESVLDEGTTVTITFPAVE